MRPASPGGAGRQQSRHRHRRQSAKTFNSMRRTSRRSAGAITVLACTCLPCSAARRATVKPTWSMRTSLSGSGPRRCSASRDANLSPEPKRRTASAPALKVGRLLQLGQCYHHVIVVVHEHSEILQHRCRRPPRTMIWNRTDMGVTLLRLRSARSHNVSVRARRSVCSPQQSDVLWSMPLSIVIFCTSSEELSMLATRSIRDGVARGSH